ncbi:hypothetical protein D3OALGA1CA_2896 [Olavius algarvensis associated proteobacterium Delta 3]|nr:hypothetical protein D3OALGA1CA_2896 [Olavius algarvensis associated proteobacterium Delta 3]
MKCCGTDLSDPFRKGCRKNSIFHRLKRLSTLRLSRKIPEKI